MLVIIILTIAYKVVIKIKYYDKILPKKRRYENSVRNDNLALNNMAYEFYWNTLTSIACSIFEWKGLPSSVNVVNLERNLLFNGSTLLFVDEVLGLITLPFNPSSSFDTNGYPVERIAYSAYTNYSKNLDTFNSVIIYDNVLKLPTMVTVDYYVNRLWDKDRTVDINCNAQKTPILLAGDKNTRLSVKNAFQQFLGNMPVISSFKKFNKESIQAIKLDAPFVAPQMNELKQSIWNDFLTAVGVPNVNVQKKERLLQDEVSRGSGGSIACRYPRLNARQFACEKINELFSNYLTEECTCNFREELLKSELSLFKEGDTNGKIHDDPGRDTKRNSQGETNTN